MEKLSKEQVRKLKTETFYRSLTFKREAVDEEARTVELAFSSEDPYRRWFGIEILGHGKGEVVMDFLTSGRAPLLNQHDHRQQIGVIENARIDSDNVGRATVRFSKNTAADEIFRDVVDGIRSNISVGYQIHDMKLIESTEEEGDTYRATSWEPHEVSIVTVPADKTVGVGRAEEPTRPEPTKTRIEVKAMDPEKDTTIDLEEIKAKAQKEAREAEISRVKNISALGKMHRMEADAQKFIEDDKSIDQFRQFVLEELGKKGIKPVETLDAEIGLNDREAKNFSFLKAINALANPTDRKAQESAQFEYEASDAVAAKMKRSAQGIMVPIEVMKRELTVGTATAGGNLVATNLLMGSFIEMFRNRLMVQRMGAMVLTGLVGDLAIPRQTGGATSYWIAESADIDADSDQSFDQVGMTPKTIGAYTEMSRKLLKQTSMDVENFVRMDLAKVLALGIDLAGITGTGANNQPKGILNVTGIGAVVGGDNGAAPGWGTAVDLWSQVAQDNADVGTLGYLTNSKVIGKLMQTEKAEGTAQFVIKDFPDANGMTSLAGARCGVSNQVPSNLTKGSAAAICSALIYGNWADLIIGMWGTLDITVNPYANDKSGGVRVVALQDVDVAVRHPESFAAMKDALTA